MGSTAVSERLHDQPHLSNEFHNIEREKNRPDRMEHPPVAGLEPRTLDSDPLLLEQSYRLRYQVYCVERQFLRAEDYPDQQERDAFDRYSVHVGALDGHHQLAATARIVKPSEAGLPLFRYCTLYPSERTLDENVNTVVEVSRVAISRRYARHRHPNGEPFLTLLKAVIHAARHEGATHLIGATDAALHRRLVRFGFPYRLAGPSVDYYGLVAPHIMSLAELDQVILGGKFPALHNFPVGLEPEPWPRLDALDGHIVWSRAEDVACR